MSKILDAIEAQRLNRRAATPRRIMPVYQAVPDNLTLSATWEWKFGATVFVNMRGPEEAREHLARQARRILAREIYGEIRALTLDAIEEALSETYRPDDDPLVQKLNAILAACDGERPKA